MFYVCFDADAAEMSRPMSVWVNPEEMAQCKSLEELIGYLRERGRESYPDVKKMIDDAQLTIALQEDTVLDEFEQISPEDFWNRFACCFGSWQKTGERISEEMKRYEGNDVYWLIDPESLEVSSEKITNRYYYHNFRASLLSGNCFTTQEEAEQMLQRIRETLKQQHEPGTDIGSVTPCYVLTAAETIHQWMWSSFHGPVHPVFYICPMYVEQIEMDMEQTEGYRKMWNVFDTYKKAERATMALWHLFDDRSFYFEGLIRSGVPLYDDSFAAV